MSFEPPRGIFTLLPIGEAGAMPSVQCPEVPGWEWKKLTKTVDVIHGIVDTAAKTAAVLIGMAADRSNGFLDAFRGSHSEQVMRHAHAPMLSMPVSSLAGRYFD